MQEKDLSVIKEHWENKETVSLKDINLQLLERSTIVKYLQNINKKTLKDIGCGDCSDTIHYAQNVKKAYAYDFSDAMLEKASIVINETSNISLGKLNILEDNLLQRSDVVITKRMLINLGNFQNQKIAIEKIYNSLEKDGCFIMLETSLDGLNNLNDLRKKFNLEIIPEPFHNTLFNLEELKNFLKEYFIIEDVKYFSTYFYLTRLYNPLLGQDDAFKYDNLAREMSMDNISLFDSKIIGPQFCMMLKKK